MSNEIAPAVKRIMDIVGNEIENAFGGEFATVEAVGKKYNEMCHNIGERLKALKESGLFVVSECDDIQDYIRCKLSKCYGDAAYRVRNNLRDGYEF